MVMRVGVTGAACAGAKRRCGTAKKLGSRPTGGVDEIAGGERWLVDVLVRSSLHSGPWEGPPSMIPSNVMMAVGRPYT
jgi:hypothetical protein